MTRVSIHPSFNCTFMELKFDVVDASCDPELVLIVPLWN